jgi:hypothetical protein
MLRYGGLASALEKDQNLMGRKRLLGEIEQLAHKGYVMRTHLTFCLSVCLLFSAVPAKASTLNFSFTFTNAAEDSSNNVYGGTVTGIVRGLADNATSAATSVEITSNTDGFGAGEYIGSPYANTWTVASGVITAYHFEDYGNSNSSPAQVCCALNIWSNYPSQPALSPINDTISYGTTEPIQFSSLSAVPLPTALPLFASGLGVMGFLGWRRKRKAAALAG